jgi:hypothetical protein
MAKKRSNIISREKELMNEEMPVENDGTIEDLLKGRKPIYSSDSSIDSMNKNNKRFYEIAAKKAFKTAFVEENEKLNELVDATYYPEEKEITYSDSELMKNLLNVV